MQLPDVGATVTAGESFGEIESVKAEVIFTPISGKVVAANTDLPSQLETLGSDPYGSGWVIVSRPDSVEQLDELMNQEAYDKLIGEDEFVRFPAARRRMIQRMDLHVWRDPPAAGGWNMAADEASSSGRGNEIKC